MSEVDKLIVRTWSALVALGEVPTPLAIAERAKLEPSIVAVRMGVLMSVGQLPRQTAVSA